MGEQPPVARASKEQRIVRDASAPTRSAPSRETAEEGAAVSITALTIMHAAPVVRVAPGGPRVEDAEHAGPVVRLPTSAQPLSAGLPAALYPQAAPVVETESVPRRQADRVVVGTAGGAALMGLGMIISGALGYIQTVVMTHMVPRSTYGVFVVVFTTAIFISQLSKFGLDGVLLRFLPTYRARQERGLATGLARFAFWVPAAISLACALLLCLLASPIARSVFHNGAYEVPLREAALIIPLNGLQSITLNGLQAIKSVKWQVYVGRVIEPIATLASLPLLYLLGLHLEALIFAYVVGILISVVIGRMAFKREAGDLIRAVPQYAAGTWMSFGAAMLFNVLTISVIQTTDVLGLGAFDTASHVSLYAAADRLAALIAMPFFALNIVFSPMISELYARGDHPKLEGMFALITRWSFAVSWPIGICCVIFSVPILGVFGKGYAAGSAALVILAAGSIINSGTGPVSSMLTMTGQLRVLWFNTAVRLISNIVLIFTLVPRFGVLGAAVASSMTVVLLNVLALVEVWWIMKIQPYRSEILKPLVAGAGAAVIGLLLMQVTRAGSGSASGVVDFAYSVGLVLAFLSVYAFVLVRMGLTNEDLTVFAAVRAKFIRM